MYLCALAKVVLKTSVIKSFKRIKKDIYLLIPRGRGALTLSSGSLPRGGSPVTIAIAHVSVMTPGDIILSVAPACLPYILMRDEL